MLKISRKKIVRIQIHPASPWSWLHFLVSPWPVAPPWAAPAARAGLGHHDGPGGPRGPRRCCRRWGWRHGGGRKKWPGRLDKLGSWMVVGMDMDSMYVNVYM